MKNLLKGLVLILCLAMAAPMSAQKCKFKKNDVRRDGSVNILTSDRMINKKMTSKFFFTSNFVYIKVEKGTGGYSLFMRLTAGNEKLDTAEGSKLYLTLSDGSEIILKTDTESIAKVTENMGLKTSIVLNSYDISLSDLKKIQELGLSTIEMATDDKDHKSEVSEKDNKELSEQITCLLKETEQFMNKEESLFN